MKVDEIKKRQNYRRTLNMCCNCKNYSSLKIERQSQFGGHIYIDEKNRKCVLGNFAVYKTAVCDLWESRDD